MTKHVLLVDDEATTLMAYRKLLESPELVVDTAETLEEATGCLSRKVYNVVISDLRLSGTSSFEGLSILKIARELCRNTKVILLTAYGNPEIKEKALSLGASDYLEKPIPSGALKMALNRLGVER